MKGIMNGIYTENWFGELEEANLKTCLSKVTDTRGLYIEIGSFEGKSTVFIANEIYPHILNAVDTWEGGPVAEYELMKYRTTPIEKNFDHNIATLTKGNVVKHKMDCFEYLKDSPSDPFISFIYIDGPHDYDSVLITLAIVWPFMYDGGVICGDDYDDKSVFGAVNDWVNAMHKTTNDKLYLTELSRTFIITR